MQTRSFPSTPDARSPAGAAIRYLLEGETGNMIHATVPPGQVNRAAIHATVSEFWHVLSGEGQIWRRDATGPGILLEASGGVTLATLQDIALTGVDRVSVGALTHSATAQDIGLDYLP